MIDRSHIEYFHIKGFRSFADIEFHLQPGANVLIGANGSGKSNFIRFFEMLSWMLKSRRLAEFVALQGGADDQLHGGSEKTPRLNAEIAILTKEGRNDYRFALTHAHPDRLLFTEEAFRFNRKPSDSEAPWQHLETGRHEASIVEVAQSSYSAQSSQINQRTARTVTHLLRNCDVYQFHNTAATSNFMKKWDAEDHDRMRSDGGNLPAILYWLEQEDLQRYERICYHVQRVLPGFDSFQIGEQHGKVALRWRSKYSDKTYGAHLSSDGSLRFFALVTLLNLPVEMLPDVLLLDEPELGLHPKAVVLIGEMIQSLAQDRQIIVATQSPLMVDTFELEQLFVLEMIEGRTELHAQDVQALQGWLDDFSVGELWQKNLLGGRP